MTNKQTSCQVFLVIKRRFIQRPKVTESKKKLSMQTKCSYNLGSRRFGKIASRQLKIYDSQWRHLQFDSD